MFPSLTVSQDGFEAQGPFARAQAEFLEPDPDTVSELDRSLRSSSTGVVAHFYMDPELQGTLFACAWPHVYVADSLMMADRAVEMARAGMKRIVVLGVDFMAENIEAVVRAAGFSDIDVLRVARTPIGCSLAESAEGAAYKAYLRKASETPGSAHVIYINTGLQVKALAQSLLPTITCTSSNVVRTVLQIAAQSPGAHVWFGPDTYMGRNIHELLAHLHKSDDAVIRRVHERHDQTTLRSLIERFHWYEQGVCVVHEMFGEHVVRQLREHYADAFVTAHLEVPGEMFSWGLQAQTRGRGVVGSTSNILGFIEERTKAAQQQSDNRKLRFVLGTEAGMITAIARKLRPILADSDLEVEIVFPVADDVVSTTDERSLSVIPGAQLSEGCSTSGGCATCPYMKMNSLEALMDLLAFSSDDAALADYRPPQALSGLEAGLTLELASKPIAAMRHFQEHGHLAADFVRQLSGAIPNQFNLNSV